ncbi:MULTISPECIES: tetratricopeptide repeat protein [Marinomonas]|uniref:tetratricopeptide repeat protein n=1 Tax=Marinomonas TaxID=28253 RepID=UPI00224327A2|nr:hypothetical protein [Marinomonas pontica]MCW8355393.1 hypothetical protein [Marinomonas pontica]
MIFAYGVMLSILVLSVVFLFASLSFRSTHFSNQKSEQEKQTFATVRRQEIAEEVECGRLTLVESNQLLRDVDEEAKAPISESRRIRSDIGFARWVLLGGMSLAILGSVSLYQWMGYSKEVIFTQDLQHQRLTPGKITHFLRYRSERYDRVEDWYYLATDYVSSKRYKEATLAFEKALEKLPIDAENRVNLLVEYAQAIFYANDNHATQKMSEVVDAILRVDPTQATALDLKGVAEFAKQNYLGAVLAWQEAIRYSNHSAERLALLSAISQARKMGEIDYQDVAPIITDQIAVKVVWDDRKLTWQPDDVLLVYAVVDGQKMPVAIQRVFPEDLGQPILLTNLDSLMPTISLAQAKRVDLIVKLANVNDNDLTKGQIIGMKRNLLVNRKEIFAINVAL